MKNNIFSDRIADVPRSFIREILKVTLDPAVISFAGGLPNRAFFPIEELKIATDNVFKQQKTDVFQYGSSEGFLQLREYIANRYAAKYNLNIPIDNIIITNGSQQGLDLLGKIILNRGDKVIIEEPGYLGAIQAFSIYKPTFIPVPVAETGMKLDSLEQAISQSTPKLIYTVPNFQNPSGISYTNENRAQVVEIIKNTDTLLIEDNPYGELRFSGEPKRLFYELLPDQTILLGSFSKIVVPGFRLGWLVAPQHIMQKIITAKQATDLHTSHFTQSILFHYLKDNRIDDHILKINNVYGRQCQAMINSIKKYFPPDVKYTTPEGGMFLWATLPKNLSSLKLFEKASQEKVVFVPGDPFYIDKKDTNTLRLNFSCVDEETIEIGIKRIAAAIETLL